MRPASQKLAAGCIDQKYVYKNKRHLNSYELGSIDVVVYWMQPCTDSFIKSLKQCANAWLRQRRAEFDNDVEARVWLEKSIVIIFCY